MKIAQEEIFGPVLATLRFDDADEAIHIANGTIYGLVSAVWTRDIRTAHKMAAGIKAGSSGSTRTTDSTAGRRSAAISRAGLDATWARTRWSNTQTSSLFGSHYERDGRRTTEVGRCSHPAREAWGNGYRRRAPR